MNKAKTPKVLIVDDEEKNLKLLDTLLTYNGYEIIKAGNGLECLNCLEKNMGIDLILLDIMMPEMDGYEVCAKIKSNKKFKHIPIIFLTALNDDDAQIKGLKFGAVDYITKPFKKEILNSRVNNHIQLKRATDEIRRLYEDLQESEKVKEALSHMIVHDLRNPLMAANGLLTLVQMNDNTLSKNTQRNITQIQNAIKEMSNLTNAILDISKLESKTMKVTPTLFDSSELLREVVNETQVIYDLAGVKLVLKEKKKGLNIKTDRELAKRILKNFLSNSLRFSSKNGCVETILEKTGNNIIYRINDEGPGIPKELRNKIFDKFYQITSREVKKSTGVGLGLAFCRMAADALKAKVWVEDRPDGKTGSSFCLELPIHKS